MFTCSNSGLVFERPPHTTAGSAWWAFGSFSCEFSSICFVGIREDFLFFLVAVEGRLASVEGVFAVIESDELMENVPWRTETNEVELSAAAAAAARGGGRGSAGLVAGQRRAEGRGHSAVSWSGGVSVLRKLIGGSGDQRREAG